MEACLAGACATSNASCFRSGVVKLSHLKYGVVIKSMDMLSFSYWLMPGFGDARNHQGRQFAGSLVFSML